MHIVVVIVGIEIGRADGFSIAFICEIMVQAKWIMAQQQK